MEAGTFTTGEGNTLRYYLSGAGEELIVMLHAQGTSSVSYFAAAKALSRAARVLLIDYYGHGESTHRAELYRIDKIAEDVLSLIKHVRGESVTLAGHSSGGLIAAYAAARYPGCRKLILEDAPFFASCGERRFRTYNYVDLSTVCHRFLNQQTAHDFVLYYFEHQYAWNFFPEKNREKIREKLTANARKYRAAHPDKPLKVLFWPRAALEAFRGMNAFDPQFGEAFYTDSFHAHIRYEEMLREIACPTVFLKAETKMGADGLQLCALTDEDAERVRRLIPNCRLRHVSCGHGIHTEKKSEFLSVFR